MALIKAPGNPIFLSSDISKMITHTLKGPEGLLELIMQRSLLVKISTKATHRPQNGQITALLTASTYSVSHHLTSSANMIPLILKESTNINVLQWNKKMFCLFLPVYRNLFVLWVFWYQQIFWTKSSRRFYKNSCFVL